jgi:hypothetical protein
MLKADFERKTKKKVKHCGIFIRSNHKFLVSKPDGVVIGESETFRYLRKKATQKYIEKLAHIDLIELGCKEITSYIDENRKITVFKN